VYFLSIQTSKMADSGSPGNLSAQRLPGNVVLITGAGGSIGLETAIRLLQEGASLSLVDISSEALDAAVTKLQGAVAGQSLDSRILSIRGDVTSESDIEDYTKKTVERFGRLDCAFLNAGISYNSTSIFDTTEELYDRVMKVNVKSGRRGTTIPADRPSA
jgi:NAD(P)-dependent dehydrogenase (short-subunit alcohol dehydrogenase family)